MRILDVYPELETMLLAKPGVETDFQAEWGWKRFLVRGKMFAAFCADNTDCALITVKSEPDFNQFIRAAYPDAITAGYHMNKIHWNSVKPDGTVPYALVQEMCERGYQLILHALPKRVQRECMPEPEK